MSTPPNKALLFLTGRWIRSTGARRSSVILVLTFAVFALVFVCVSAFTPTAEQEADAAFGAYQQQTYTSVNVEDLDPGFLPQASSALTSAVPGTHLLIETDQLRPDSFAKTYVQAPLAVLRFVEDPGLQDAFPDRYTLDQGSWPRSPFDVVVSRHLLDALPDPTEFTVLSGRVTMNVVGVVTDAYAQRGDLIVGGPGTWESIKRPAAGREYQPVEAYVTVLFGAGTPVADVARALQKILPPQAQGDGASNIKANHSTRSQVASLPVAEFGSDQLVVSYLPLLLVVLLVSALVVGQTRGADRANADRLVAIGVRRSRVLLSQVVALSVAAAASIAAGLGVGWLVAIALRASLLPRFADQTLSPLPGLDGTALAIAASSLVLITAGTLWPARSNGATRWSVVPRYLAKVPIGMIRRVAVVLLIVAALRVDGSITSVVASYLAVAAVLLATPDALRVVVWSLPRSNPRTFVTRRLMWADLGRQAAAVAVVGCCLALPICAGTQLASKKASDSSFTSSIVPVGQIWVQNNGGSGGGDIAGVAQAVSEVPDIGRPVVLRDMGFAPPYGPNSSAAFFQKSPTSGNSSLNIMVVDSADQVRRLVGDQLPDDAEAVLDAGGVLDFTSVAGDQKFVVTSAAGKRLLVTPALPTLKVSLDRQFSKSFGGAVLLSTAKKLKLPTNLPRTFIYTDVTPTVIEEAAAAAVDAGYDTEFVQYSVPPPEPELPTNAYVFLAGLVLGGFAVLLFVITGQARRLRTYSSRLVAIGLGPRWTLSVLGIQAAVIVGVGLLAGVSAGILGVKITSDNYAATDVPVLPIALACGATIIAAGLATALAVRALTATEHPEVT